MGGQWSWEVGGVFSANLYHFTSLPTAGAFSNSGMWDETLAADSGRPVPIIFQYEEMIIGTTITFPLKTTRAIKVASEVKLGTHS